MHTNAVIKHPLLSAIYSIMLISIVPTMPIIQSIHSPPSIHLSIVNISGCSGSSSGTCSGAFSVFFGLLSNSIVTFSLFSLLFVTVPSEIILLFEEAFGAKLCLYGHTPSS